MKYLYSTIYNGFPSLYLNKVDIHGNLLNDDNTSRYKQFVEKKQKKATKV